MQDNHRRRLLLTGIVILIAAGAFAIRYWLHLSKPWTRNGQVRAQIVQVAPRVTGPVVDLAVQDNQLVHKSDLLFQIDPSDYQLMVDNARAQLNRARDTVASLEAAVQAAQALAKEAQVGVDSAESQIGAAEAELESAGAKVRQTEAAVSSANAGIKRQEAVVEEIKREATRARRLADQNAGPVETAEGKEAKLTAEQAALESAKSNLLEAEANLAQAHAGVNQAQAHLVIARNGLSAAQAKRDTADANLQQAKANLGEAGEANVRIQQAKVELAQAELKLSWTSIHAPVDGYITNLSIHLGDTAVANQPLLALVDVNSFWIDAYFQETKIDGMGVGDQAIVTLMVYSNQPLEGRVIGIGWGIAQQDGGIGQDLLPSISPTFEWIRLAQRIPVQIGRLELPEGIKLRVGMTASVQVKKGTAVGATN